MKSGNSQFETIVLGLGAMGSAALYQLAKRGNHVLGIDQFSPPHIYGSTHGDTRITRLAIGEGDHYSPLAIRSHQLWREIERETGTQLLTSCGGLIISSGTGNAISRIRNFFSNTVTAAEKHSIRHELLNAEQIRSRFPQFHVQDNENAYFEPDAGFVRPEQCIKAQLQLAEKRGASIRRNERVLNYKIAGDAVVVTTDRGEYVAEKLVITAGPWLPDLLGERDAKHFSVVRQVLFWFDVEASFDQFTEDKFPIFIWGVHRSKQGIYGFPAIDGPRGGLKIASEQYAATTTPDAVDRTVTDEEKSSMHRDFVAPYFPGVSSKCVKAVTCLYTVTPDSAFVVDVHPESDRVMIASPCSGHGFKHSAAIGEALSEWACDGQTRFNLGPFRLNRF